MEVQIEECEKIIDSIIEELAGSDYTLQCGANAIKELRVYRLDMAEQLRTELAKMEVQTSN